MPTSVLLAILAGAGLLALAPALVRRYDADERLAAERENSTARVLDRDAAKQRTGSHETEAETADDEAAEAESTSAETSLDELLTQDDDDATSALRVETPTAEAESSPPSRGRGWERRGVRRAESVGLSTGRPESKGRQDQQEVVVASALRAWWQRRYRRVLYVLLALNLAELLGVIFIGPGFWIGAGISLGLLVLFLRFLRVRARNQQRRRPAAARVPRQVSAEPEPEPAEPQEYADDYEESDSEVETEPVAEPPSRRRTGGIRGRSYESPANL